MPPSSAIPLSRPALRRRPLDWIVSLPFFAMHAGALVGVFIVGFSWSGVLLSLGLYFAVMAAVTIGYHRYFSHRSFKTSRPAQFLLAFLCQMYRTTDTSRNNVWLALLTLGEGWHNNHHYYQASARQGFFWWEVDVSYYLLKLAQALGIVWDVRTPPPDVLRPTAE
jgi:fatty-acid desaturase